MKYMAAILMFLPCLTFAQKKIDRSKFGKVDEYVKKVGPLEGGMLKVIVDSLTHRQSVPQADQVRAIYMWEAMYIEYNAKGKRHPNQTNSTASAVLSDRQATDEGYANLFKAMCDMAHLKSEVIKGMAKRDARDIGKISQKWTKHTWNAVQIDGAWYLLDIAWSVGESDRKFRFYKKNFTDAWFLTDRELFGLSHYPNDKNWQLLDTPFNKSNFTFAPIVGSSAIVNEVYLPQNSLRGNVRGKADTTKKMMFEIGNPDLIKKVEATNRTGKKIPAIYKIDNNVMYVDVPFTSEGDYAFSIYVNDALAYTYKADVGKAKKKKPVVSEKQKAKDSVAKQKAIMKKEKAKEDAIAQKEKAAAKKEKEKQNLAAQKEKAAAKKQKDKQDIIDQKQKAIDKKEKEKQDAVEKKEKAEQKKEDDKRKAEERAAAKREKEESKKKK